MIKKVFTLLFTFALVAQANDNQYGTKIIKGINIQGYDKFDYAFWMHPYQLNKELENLIIKPVLDNMKTIIPQGSIVIDIGAHSGDTSVAYALVVGKKGKVIAFEPNEKVFKVLKLNSDLNPNIVPVNRAVTEQDGTFTFHYTDSGLCNGGYAQMLQQGVGAVGCIVPLKVKGVNLEKWLNTNFKNEINKIKFIKIDTEGYDKHILKSISKFVLKYKPVIQCEVFPALTANEKAEFHNLINSLNYKCFLGGLENLEPVKNRKALTREDFVNIKFADILCFPK